jgi:neurotransmitter:Na+ symporter, NSS family
MQEKSVTPISVLPHREHWTSKLSFILASTGAAVGLGNIWKFPYMAGDNGGSAFVLIYLICVIIIGIPLMIAEMLLGRQGQQNPVNSFYRLAREANKNTRWSLVGWLGAITLVLVLSFYSVVAGWSLAYMIKTWMGDFNHLSVQGINSLWQQFLANPVQLMGWHALFMFMTMWVVARGVKSGLENASKIMMPGLFLTLIILDVYAYLNGDFSAGFRFLFAFNLHKINSEVIISAMGHAFFTLAIGAGCMMVYGSYLTRQTKLSGAVMTIVVLDVLVAILAGLAIFPLIFGYHLVPEGGPGLMFQVLPIAFANMVGGQFFGGLFFVLLLFAAWSSSISIAEPLVILLTERHGFKRLSASILVGGAGWLLGLASLLSFNVWQDFKLFQHWTIFGAITDLSTNLLLPLGGLGIALFAGWVMPKLVLFEELKIKKVYFILWHFLIRYIVPIGILLIILDFLLGRRT